MLIVTFTRITTRTRNAHFVVIHCANSCVFVVVVNRVYVAQRANVVRCRVIAQTQRTRSCVVICALTHATPYGCVVAMRLRVVNVKRVAMQHARVIVRVICASRVVRVVVTCERVDKFVACHFTYFA